MAPAKIRSRNIRQCVERQPHHDLASRRSQQRAKLAFRRLQRRIGHVVDEADIEVGRVRLTELDRRLPRETSPTYERHGTERLPTVWGHRRLLERWTSRQNDTHMDGPRTTLHISCRFLE